MIRRTLDGRYLTDVANHPEVRPHLMGQGPLDLSELVGNPANIALQAEGGGWLLENKGGGTYEVHSMFLPQSRGAGVRKALTAALEYVFTHTDCERLVTRLPKGNARAAALGRMAGFRPWFEMNGDQYARIELEDWAQSSHACRKAGEWFHDRLEAAKIAAGSPLEVHEDDASHDHAVGATVLMCKAANAIKGVRFYNQWAVVAGYAPVTLVSLNPMVIDVVDAVLEGPDMEVLLCR